MLSELVHHSPRAHHFYNNKVDGCVYIQKMKGSLFLTVKAFTNLLKVLFDN